MDFIAPDYNSDFAYHISASVESNNFSIHHVDRQGNVVRSMRNAYDLFEFPKINKPEEVVFLDLPLLCLPKKEFDEAMLSDYLNKYNPSNKSAKDGFFIKEDVVFAYRVPKRYQPILKIYKKVEVRHQMEWMMDHYFTRKEDACYLHGTENKIFLTVFKNGQLQLHQQYTYQVLDDIVYRWVTADRQFFGDDELSKVFISGAIHDFSIFTPFVSEIETLDEKPYDYARYISVMKEGIL